ncbi:MAG: hypothetical protein WC343_00055 [Bacilli bacterium]|jgi:hypothetical protein
MPTDETFTIGAIIQIPGKYRNYADLAATEAFLEEHIPAILARFWGDEEDQFSCDVWRNG